MTQSATFYGASDDLIEVDGIKGGDEFNVYDTDKGPDGSHGRFVIGGKVRVRAYYGRNGCWSFAVGQVEEGVPFPGWPITIAQHPKVGYSVLLTIECPDDATLVRER